MDIRKYEVFLRASEYSSLTKAGEALGYTQSGISHMMKSLEAEMGFPLFKRSSKGVTLNENGERILPIIRHLLSWNEQLEQTVAAINGLATGNINIATFSSMSVHWLPRIIKDFQLDYPKIHINLLEGGVEDVDGWLQDGVADIGFVSRQPQHSFDWLPLKEDSLLAILPKDHPDADRDVFPVENFVGQPFILSAFGFDYDIHRVLERAGVTADIKFSSKDDFAIVSMVENGLGLSILPELMLAWCRERICALPLEPAASRTLGVAIPSLKSLSPAGKKFLDYTKHVLARDGLV